MSSPHTTVLIVDDDELVRAGLSALVEEPGRTVVICQDPEAAVEIAPHYPLNCAFVDIRYSGPFGFEGLQLIEKLHRISPQATILAISGDASSELQAEALRRGATAFLVKPLGAAEIDPYLPPIASDGEPASMVIIPTIAEILEQKLIEMVFQPIVTIGDRRILGWEALARVRTNTPFSMPTSLFRYARRTGHSFDLNCACAVAAIESGAGITRKGRLFINVDPDILPRGDEFIRAVTAAAQRSNVEMSAIVFEVTERHEIDAHAGLDALQALRATGASLAFDDLGVAYAHFPQLGRIRPAFMKVAQEFGGGLEDNAAARAIVGHFRDLARAFECQLILEGIETPSDARAASELGVELAQGYHFGRPGPLTKGQIDSLCA